MGYGFDMGKYGFGGAPSWLPAVLVALAIWSLFWKGLALWHAARRGQGVWFVIMLVINTTGILEIIYLFFILKIKGRDLFKKNG